MKSLYLLLIFTFSAVIYADNITVSENIYSYQSALKDSSELSSKKNEDEHIKVKLKITNPFYFDSPSFTRHEFLYSEFYKDYSMYNNLSGNINEEESRSLSQSKLDLSKAMKMNYNFIKKNDLGTFGKILGVVGGVSAVGLGVYHLIKYKDEYFK